jgi:hypothetical protein
MKLQIGKAASQRLSGDDLVSMTIIEDGRLHVIQAVHASDLSDWIAYHKRDVASLLDESGAVLFRGFSVRRTNEFESVISVFSEGERFLMEDQNTHNQFVTDDEDVWYHNDYCDRPRWPRRLIFWCELTSSSGGQTPFVDCARVYRLLPAVIKDRFEGQGWILQRRFHRGIGVDANGFFKTCDREEIRHQLDLLGAFDERWDGDLLAGFSVRFAPSFSHPVTHHSVWANNITFSNIAMVESTIREQLLSDYSLDELPVNTYWGDGSPISADVVAALSDLYRANEVCFDWQQGDVLAIDNIRCVHGRRPILAPQRVNVGVCEFYERLNAWPANTPSTTR